MIQVTRRTGRRTYVTGGLGTVVAGTVIYVAFAILLLPLVAVATWLTCAAWLTQRALILHRRGVEWGWREWTVLLALGFLAGLAANWVWI